MKLQFKKFFIDTNLCTKMVNNEDDSREALQWLTISGGQNLFEIMNNLTTNKNYSYSEEQIPIFNFRYKEDGKSLLEYLIEK